MKKTALFTGCGTALITPFRNGNVDYDALSNLIERQITAGIDALIVCGTTAETATLTKEERRSIVSFCIQQVNSRLPVIVGTGSNNTTQAIALSREAKALGADALLVVTPYYNKASQAGLIAHFSAIAEAVDPLPIILYNVPSRTGVSCSAETYLALSKVKNIAGVKEASGNFALIQKTLHLCGENFSLWSGNDEDTAALCVLGGAGVISVASNLLPHTMTTLTDLCRRGQFAEAGSLQVMLSPLIRALFSEVNPIPVKTALSARGLCSDEFRLPLCSMGEAAKAELLNVLKQYQQLR